MPRNNLNTKCKRKLTEFTKRFKRKWEYTKWKQKSKNSTVIHPLSILNNHNHSPTKYIYINRSITHITCMRTELSCMIFTRACVCLTTLHYAIHFCVSFSI